MKTKNLLVISIILCSASIVILITSFSTFSIDITYNRVISALGISVTTLAFLVGCYFAFIAIKADKQLRETEVISANITHKHKELTSMQKSYAEFYLKSIEFQIDITNLLYKMENMDSDRLDRRKTHLYLLKSRLSYEHPALENELKLALLKELGQLGTQKDLVHLESLTKESPNGEVRQIASISKRQLEQRLKRKEIAKLKRSKS